MKKIFGINVRYLFIVLGLTIVVFLAECGLTALTVEVPESGNANQIATFKLHCGTMPRIANGTYTTRLIAGFLAPKSWRFAENSTVNMTSDKGNALMVMIPSTEIEPASGLPWSAAAKKRFGIGPNLLDDLEWVVFRTPGTYTFDNNEDITFDVTVNSKLGPDNMLVKLGFFVNSSIENLRPDDTDYTKFAFSNTFEVKNGSGDLVDFVNPQLGKVEPVKSLDNDIITLTFDSGVTQTTLSNTDDIFLCAKAILDNGTVLEICEQTAKTKLTPIGGKRYRIDFWPRGYFNVAKGRTIIKLEYFYKDTAGSGKVGYGNTSEPFKYTFKCD